MPTTLTLTDVDVAFGDRPLFSGLSLVAADGDVTAVVGPNGSGKTTLFRTIVGDLPVEHGSVRLAPPAGTIAWLPQILPDPSESLVSYAVQRTGVGAAALELERATAALELADERSMPSTAERYDRALTRWLALGGADLEGRLPEVAARVGVHVDPSRALGSLSGGQAARANLVAVLLSQYDVLLLDEPTNNLDSQGISLVTEFVRSRSGPVLIASHDRRFLDDVATNVVELDLHQQRVHHYRGGWSAYRAERELRRSQAWVAYETYVQQRDSLLDQSRQRAEWAAKGRSGPKATKEPDKHIREKHRARADRQSAKGAHLVRALGRLDEVEQPRKEWQLRYSIDAGSPSAEVVASLVDVVIERGEFRFGPVSLVLARGDRIHLTGANGAGKSTVLRALLDGTGIVPGVGESGRGRHHLGARVRTGVLDQERAVFDTDEPVLDIVRRELGLHPDSGRPWDPADTRNLLAKFGIGADHVGRSARSLSMGERTRCRMATFQGRGVNTLVLDEPTNHLDVPAIEQLESAVAAFPGTVLVVSHDADFVGGIGVTTQWHVANGTVAVREPG